MRIVVALGGNALLQRGDRPDAGIQLVHVRAAAEALAPIAARHDLLICHGNGPQVGMLSLESESDATLSRPYFGTPNAAPLKNVSLAELAGMSFPAGSMAPKIEGCRRFVAATGHRAAIGSLTDAVALLAGTAGTTIAPTGAIAHEPIAWTPLPGPHTTLDYA